MTYDNFYAQYVGEILKEKPAYIRNGQALMNFLFDIWPEEYNKITEGKYIGYAIDCFYNDNIIPKTLKHLEQVWHNKK
jgi:hypothetical protein